MALLCGGIAYVEVCDGLVVWCDDRCRNCSDCVVLWDGCNGCCVEG